MEQFLTPRQVLFVTHYLETGNATSSYKQAYGTADDTVAAVNGSRLLRNAKIRQFLNRHLETMTQRTEIRLESVVRRIAKIAATAPKDADRLKALDMLMKHLGGYTTLEQLIEAMDEQRIEQLAQTILKRLKNPADET